MSIARRLGDAIASPRGRILVPLAGVLLALPSLSNGLVFDDIIHRLKARGVLGSSLGARLDLFSFVPGDPAAKVSLYDQGFLPWTASPDLRIAFLRPLSAALHFFDYNVLDRWPWAMHAESLGIYAAVIALAAAFYRRLVPVGVAMLAALLFAIDDAHGLPVGWLANRNALIATAFGVLAITLHDRWRRDGWKLGAALAPVAFMLAILSAELGLGAMAYLVAHAVTLDPARRRARAWAMAPYAGIVVGWQVVYRRLGYGAFGSGLYADPIADTWAFVRVAPSHAAALLLGQLAVPPADVYGFAPTAVRAAVLFLAVAFVSFVAWVLAPRLRSDPGTRFFALGMVLAIAPVIASFPSDRLLLFVGLGAFGLVAQVIGDLREPAPIAESPRERPTRGLRRVWIGLHLVLAPLLLPVTSSLPGALQRLAERAAAIPTAGPELARQTLILANVPTMGLAQPWLFPRDPARVPPRRLRGLADTPGQAEITREDTRTLLVATLRSADSDPLLALFRDSAHPIRVGDSSDVPGLHVDVLRVDERGLPTSMRYRFDRDLADGSFRWVIWSGDAFVETPPPRVGERILVGRRE